MEWLFLVHQVYTPNSRERVKVWRAIRKTGAVLYRNSVYVLPYSKERLEDFQWVSQQINDSRGEASVFVSSTRTAREDVAIQNLFDKARKEDYQTLQVTAEKVHARMIGLSKRKALTGRVRNELMRKAAQLRETFQDIRKVDFFSQSPPKRLTGILDAVAAWISSAAASPIVPSATPVRVRSTRDFRNKTWTTREDIHIDRICSAWLIRRFIDPGARFIFAPEGKLPKDAIAFDVLGAEFSHRGEDCTFETLIKAFRIRDRAVREIAEITHDIDLKDGKFERAEAKGLDLVIRGLSATCADDHRLLEAGSMILDGLHAHLSGSRNRKRKR